MKGATVAAAGLLLPIAGSKAGSNSSSGKRPDLIFIMTDDQTWDSMGYENPMVQTPNMDRLAERGMIFRAGHCAAIPCVPSRACMTSGLYYPRWKRRPTKRSEGTFREGSWTWAHALRTADYGTGLFGKMNYRPIHAYHGFDVMKLSDHGPHDRMWRKGKTDAPIPPRDRDDYLDWLASKGMSMTPPKPEKKRPTFNAFGAREWHLSIDLHPISYVRDRAIEFVDEKRRIGSRFAAAVSFRFPHFPLIPAEPFASMYDAESIPVPTDEWREMEGYIDELDFDPNQGLNWLGRRPHTKEFQFHASKYWALVSQIDDAVGTIVEHADLDNTIVIFSSDHGDYMGKRGRIAKVPPVPFDAISRVPYFAVGAGVARGTVCENPVSLVDIAPTFLRAAGLDIPPDLDGHPLQDYFADPGFGNERSIHCHGGKFDMVQMGKIKYFRQEETKGEMLFDLSTDEWEKRNLATDPKFADMKARMSEELDKILNKAPVTLPEFPIPTAAKQPT